jgi:predicted DsbA family dithiol-disulfide isomerase
VWLDRVKKVYGDDLSINWRNFSLEQVNSKRDPDWKVWDEHEDFTSRGMPALRAGEAARRQGQELFERFHMALLTARHGGERRNIAEMDVLEEIATSVGLNIDKFREDMADPELVQIIAKDHTEAADQRGIFGTPTFVFENGASGYLKMFIPPEEDDLSLLDSVVKMVGSSLYFGELKRPQPPWPKGIFRPE